MFAVAIALACARGGHYGSMSCGLASACASLIEPRRRQVSRQDLNLVQVTGGRAESTH